MVVNLPVVASGDLVTRDFVIVALTLLAVGLAGLAWAFWYTHRQ